MLLARQAAALARLLPSAAVTAPRCDSLWRMWPVTTADAGTGLGTTSDDSVLTAHTGFHSAPIRLSARTVRARDSLPRRCRSDGESANACAFP